MKVENLDKSHEGRKFVVTAVAVDEAERRGWVDDTARLLNRVGTFTEVNMYNEKCLQAWVEWDDEGPDGPGHLMLAHDDEVELI